MIEELEIPTLEVRDGIVTANTYDTIDEYIRFNYEHEADSCLKEFSQLLSCCEVLKKENRRRVNDKAKSKIQNLVNYIMLAKNQQELDKAYKQIMSLIEDSIFRVPIDSKHYLEEYIEKETEKAEQYRQGNSLDGYLFSSGKRIDEVKEAFYSNYTIDMKHIMKEYIETAYKHLSAKFTLQKEAESLMKQYRQQQEWERQNREETNEPEEEIESLSLETEGRSSIDTQEGEDPFKNLYTRSNDAELEECRIELVEKKEQLRQERIILESKKAALEACHKRQEEIELLEQRGHKEVTDDDPHDWRSSWEWKNPVDKNFRPARKDSNGNFVPYISTHEAKYKVEREIKELEKIISGIEERVKELEEEEKELESRYLSIKERVDRKNKGQNAAQEAEARFFGMGKLRKAIAILTGKKAKMDRLIDQAKSGQFSDDDLDELDGTFRKRGVK